MFRGQAPFLPTKFLPIFLPSLRFSPGSACNELQNTPVLVRKILVRRQEIRLIAEGEMLRHAFGELLTVLQSARPHASRLPVEPTVESATTEKVTAEITFSPRFV